MRQQGRTRTGQPDKRQAQRTQAARCEPSLASNGKDGKELVDRGGGPRTPGRSPPGPGVLGWPPTTRQRLAGVDLRLAGLSTTPLAGTDFRGADLREAWLRDTCLDAADLRGADLRSAHLEGADLHAADLRGADLRGAHLEGADLDAADLRDADLTAASLRGARFSLLTSWPAGFDPVAAGARLVRAAPDQPRPDP